MPDYKQMYLIMIQASEEAINLLIKAQQECEELYLSARERPLFSGRFFLPPGPAPGNIFEKSAR